MGKKVLILSGSPRKNGNTDALCQKFKQGAESAGHLVDLVRLSELELKACIGCNVCRTKGRQCVFPDAMTNLIARLEVADVVVLATPVYFYGVTAQMKTFMDRMYAHHELVNKTYYLLVVGAAPEAQYFELISNSLKAFVSCLGPSDTREVIYGTGVTQVGDIQSNPAMEQAHRAGLNI
jgi:multimeric flavodoxin WrbA